MLKNSIFTLAMALVVAASLSMPADAGKPKKPKTIKPQNQSAQDSLQSQQGQYDSGSAGSSGDYGNNSAGNSASGNNGNSGGGDSISMFKAGNTSLPSGTYAMTNVSTGAAFVVIVDDSGDMRAQDARAMHLVDESKTTRNSRKNNSKRNSGGSPYGNLDNNSDYNDPQYANSQYLDSNRNGSNNSYSSNSPPPLLSPQPTPASAVLPAKSGHPLLQGSNQSSVYPAAQPGSLLPNLFTGQNPLSQGQAANGQIPGGMKGALQAELQRQLGKQIMKHAPNIEQQVRKVIKGIN